MLRARLLLLLAALPAPLAPTQTIAVNSPDGKPFSTRIVAYHIDAKVDMRTKTLEATETLEYRNASTKPLASFPFHLYLNAFRPQSSFSQETHQSGGIRAVEESYPPEKLGGIEIKHISADGLGDLTGAMHFTAPDDGNQNDHTVMEVPLPKPLAPGATIRFQIAFHDKFPVSIARNGYKRDFLMGGQWFPKVGLFWHDAWNCHQYHSTTEFFSDFGTYDVKLTLPQRFVVGASGIPVGEQQNSDGTKTLAFHGEDIHDFAWAASPTFIVADDSFTNSLGTVKLHALILKVHADQAQRHLSILKRTMEKFDQWYGPFPYKQMTLIDPEPNSEIFGMEYPTLITAGTEWWAPAWEYVLPEGVTEHEFGHQYWYGMVATNEFEEAWLDEGINEYTEGKVMGSLFGARTSGLNARTAHASDAELARMQYLAAPEFDPLSRHAWQFESGNSYGATTYGKTATMLDTLEGLIGEDTVRRALHVYFMRYRFTHPTGADFLHTIEQVSGRNDLQPYFQQAVYGTQVLDYNVESFTSAPQEWWKGRNADGPYHTSVVLRRKGDFILPVTVEVTFANGEKVRQTWDGEDRWVRYSWDRKDKAVSAEIDPDHVIPLDTNFFNNSYTLASHATARLKLANYWLFAQQLVAQWMSLFV